MKVVVTAGIAIICNPAERASGYDQGEYVPEENTAGHGLRSPRTRLAAKCSPTAAKVQTTTLRNPSHADATGITLNACPSAPTAKQAVDALSIAFARSFVRSLWMRLIEAEDSRGGLECHQLALD